LLLNPEVLAIVILDIIFLIFATIAFFISLRIFFLWDMQSTSTKQYNLEKQSFLSSTIIKYILFTKIILFVFFVFTLDKISAVLTGAMCAAGVVDATKYGIYLLLFKLLNIYLFGYWLVIHYFDLKTKELKFTKLKFGFYLFIYLLFLSETVLELLMFSSIDITKLVSCCGTLYSNSSNSYISSLFLVNSSIFTIGFYSSFIILLIVSYFKNEYLHALINLIFLIFAITSLILFFSTYIYELPTHHCPFCILQKEYNYIGYALYIFLFVGTFFGFSWSVSKLLLKVEDKNYKYLKISLIFIFIYVVLISFYPLSFYLKNGVFL